VIDFFSCLRCKSAAPHVPRSPGGTPIGRPAKAQDPLDAASLIAQALKKKFANAKTKAVEEKEKDDDSDWDDKENSPLKPAAPWGVHVLKKGKNARLQSPLTVHNSADVSCQPSSA
jgi:hypothetical protein